MPGRLYAIVGPSGAGKDTLMEAVAPHLPGLVMARRVITRPAAAGGEDFDGVSETEFDRRLAAGDFALHWAAHGLRYGVPISIEEDMAADRDVAFNGSRAALAEAAARYPSLRVLHITAKIEVLAERLAARGRETAEDIAARLRRADTGLPQGLKVITIDNSGDLQDAVNALLTAFHPERT
ncbi:ribose-phosphate pyrophosphokinase [Actibacterium mucosum KCTC 23349]|uniref:Ribose 1,5-bisphosphate phosphokinase PhnN n=1 Tax=Actibacterium mucosum KCTC 23349 TaxID=1454373 RepID=A0A037ZLE9_9RHOB|nr:phosphonate metabolism protein/1,5-bisphosphokinase (PRPP-forming) PhnN [Actibacterium mucosum]KAJ55676.1 ribose-phosphate pyrophosphokinase [Actibacterium mucosum KCTC 23349]